MRRALVAGAAVVCLVFLVWAAVIRVIGLLDVLPLRRQPASVVAEARAGDAPYHRFLNEVAGRVPRTARVLLMAHDPGRQDLFRVYRAFYELYPVPHWYVPIPSALPDTDVIKVPAGPELIQLVQREGLTHAALYDTTRETAGRVYRIVPGKGATVRLERVSGGAIPVGERAGEFESRRPWGWAAGLVLLLALGLVILEATGLREILAGRHAVQAAWAWLIGAGITSYWLMLWSMAGWRWSLPVALAPWLPALCGLGWRRLRGPRTPAEPAAPMSMAETGNPRLRHAGFALIGLAFATSLLGSLVPLSAWSNWDAWAIWGMKLRGFWSEQSLPVPFLRDLKYDFSHPDYPPGITLLQVYFGMWTDGIGEATMRLLHPWYLLALALLVAGIGSDFGLGAERWLFAGGCVLVPRLFEQGYNGYSDLPLAAATTGALGWLVLVSRGRAPAWTLGLACGLAALIKNEGLILCAGCITVLGFRVLRRRMSVNAFVSAGLMMGVLAAPWRLEVRRIDLRATFDIQPRRILAQAPALAPYLVKAPLLEGFGPALTVEHLRGGGRSDAEFWFTNQRVSWAGFWWFAAVVLGCYVWTAGWRDPIWAFPALQAMQMASTWLVTLGAQYEVLWVLVTSVDRMLLQSTPFMFAWLAACLGTGMKPGAEPAASRPPGDGDHRKSKRR